jgi:hypothetical protein
MRYLIRSVFIFGQPSDDVFLVETNFNGNETEISVSVGRMKYNSEYIPLDFDHFIAFSIGIDKLFSNENHKYETIVSVLRILECELEGFDFVSSLAEFSFIKELKNTFLELTDSLPKGPGRLNYLTSKFNKLKG